MDTELRDEPDQSINELKALEEQLDEARKESSAAAIKALQLQCVIESKDREIDQLRSQIVDQVLPDRQEDRSNQLVSQLKVKDQEVQALMQRLAVLTSALESGRRLPLEHKEEGAGHGHKDVTREAPRKQPSYQESKPPRPLQVEVPTTLHTGLHPPLNPLTAGLAKIQPHSGHTTALPSPNSSVPGNTLLLPNLSLPAPPGSADKGEQNAPTPRQEEMSTPRSSPFNLVELLQQCQTFCHQGLTAFHRLHETHDRILEHLAEDVQLHQPDASKPADVFMNHLHENESTGTSTEVGVVGEDFITAVSSCPGQHQSTLASLGVETVKPSDMPAAGIPQDKVVEINVSGVVVTSLKSVLMQFPDSKLYAMFDATSPGDSQPVLDAHKRPFLPYDPICFQALLDALQQHYVLGKPLHRVNLARKLRDQMDDFLEMADHLGLGDQFDRSSGTLQYNGVPRGTPPPGVKVGNLYTLLASSNDVEGV